MIKTRLYLRGVTHEKRSVREPRGRGAFPARVAMGINYARRVVRQATKLGSIPFLIFSRTLPWRAINFNSMTWPAPCSGTLPTWCTIEVAPC